VDDDGRELRGIISRAFGAIAAITHAKDEEEVREIAARHAYWIEFGREMPITGAEELAQRYTDAARSRSRRG
jgi:hypothetical protein